MTSGFKRDDFKPCKLCGRGVMHGGHPIVYRVRIEEFVIDVRAVHSASTVSK